MTTGLAAVAALLLDRCLGEPPNRLHPLVAFGQWSTIVEQRCRRLSTGDPRGMRLLGVLAWVVAVLPPVALVALLSRFEGSIPWVSILCAWFAIGLWSLREHAVPVASALLAGHLPLAREQLACIVSRDVSEADSAQISTATVESVLENGCDAVFGALFWLALGGAPGVVAYRLANTLDAMWGYRNERYRDFGWAAARIDDVLGFVPARLTVLSYALAGRTRCAWRAYREQAHLWYSPNAGPVMASGAGALGVRIGGEARYFGRLKQRPELGFGDSPQATDIARAIALVERSALIWLAVMFAVSIAFSTVTFPA